MPARFLRCVLRCQRGFGAILRMPAGFSGGSWPTAGGMGRTSELFQNGPNRKNRAKARTLIQLHTPVRWAFDIVWPQHWHVHHHMQVNMTRSGHLWLSVDPMRLCVWNWYLMIARHCETTHHNGIVTGMTAVGLHGQKPKSFVSPVEILIL